MSKPKIPPAALPEEVLRRVNQARGDYLRRTGREMEWSTLGRLMGWKPSTVTDVKGGRPLRVVEIAQIAEALEVSPAWIAFEQGTMWGTPAAETPRPTEGIAYTTGAPLTRIAHVLDEEERRGREITAEAARRPRRVAEGGRSSPAAPAPATPAPAAAARKSKRDS